MNTLSFWHHGLISGIFCMRKQTDIELSWFPYNPAICFCSSYFTETGQTSHWCGSQKLMFIQSEWEKGKQSKERKELGKSCFSLLVFVFTEVRMWSEAAFTQIHPRTHSCTHRGSRGRYFRVVVKAHSWAVTSPGNLMSRHPDSQRMCRPLSHTLTHTCKGYVWPCTHLLALAFSFSFQLMHFVCSFAHISDVSFSHHACLAPELTEDKTWCC